ncbi:uncharacterized protein CG3556-like [Glandiceps talaboti]
MKAFSAFLVVAVFGINNICSASNLWEVCGPSTNNELQSRAKAAYQDAVDWLKSQQNDRYGWDHDVTSRVVLSLQLTNKTWFNDDDLNSQLNVKEMEIELLAKLSHVNSYESDSGSDSKSTEDDDQNQRDPLSAGRLAYPIIALHSTCHDVTDFHGHDLIELLNSKIEIFPDGDFNHFFQYAWALLALCTTNSDISASYIKEIKDGQLEDGGFQLGTDVTAMVVTALSCVRSKTKYDVHVDVDDILQRAVNKLLATQNMDATFGNINANVLVVQALHAAADVDVDPSNWQCENVMDHILNVQDDNTGAFAIAVLTTMQVLPSLTGTNFGAVDNAHCKDDEDGGEDPTVIGYPITMQLIVRNDISGDGLLGSYNTQILNGTSLYNAMLHISEETAGTDGAFVFVATDTAWGHSIRTIFGVSASVTDKLYWSISNSDGRLNTGADGYFPEDGDIISFKYTSWA